MQNRKNLLDELSYLFDKTNDAIIVMNFGEVLYLNHAAYKLLSYQLEDLEGKDFLELLAGDAYPKLSEAFTFARENKTWLGKMNLLPKTLTPFPASIRIEYHQDLYFVFCIDMSEHFKIQESEREQRLLAEALKDIASRITSTLDLKEVLANILDNLGRLIPHQAAYIILVHNNYAFVVQSRGYSQLELDMWTEHNRATPITEQVIFREIIAKQEATKIANPNYYQVPQRENSLFYLCAPILLKESIIGFIGVEGEDGLAFENSYLERLQALADQAAIAIQNARLYEQVQNVATFEERQRVSREFHDSVTQTLFSISMIAESLPRVWQDAPPNAIEQFDELHRLTRGAMAETRTLLLELRPTKLIETDLSELLQQLAESLWSRRQVELDLNIDEKADVPKRIKVVFYRIAQEAFHNILKHSKAQKVALHYQADAKSAVMQIFDNGIGFELNNLSTKGMGLSNMRERAKSIHADLVFKTQSNSGTSLKLFWQAEEGE